MGGGKLKGKISGVELRQQSEIEDKAKVVQRNRL